MLNKKQWVGGILTCNSKVQVKSQVKNVLIY